MNDELLSDLEDDRFRKPKMSKLRIGDFLIGKSLGSGSFGKVKAGKHIVTGHDVAIKILNRYKIKSLDVVEKIRREIQFLKLFDHPHIIKLYQVISTPTDFFMIMEYVSGGELFDYIVSHGRLRESEARRFFQQIISGVDYCHQHHVIHRDLKPENLLLDSKFNVKIADFGLSNMMNDGEFLKTSCGSPNYAAPEVISGKLYVGPEVDIWSCGVILFAFFCGFLPFEDEHIPSLFRKIKNGSFFIPDYVPLYPRELIEGMIKVNVIQRWSMERIKNHEWFKCNLPKYMFPEYSNLTANIDMAIVSEICLRFSVTENDVINSLSSMDSSDQLAIAYRLIYSNKNIYRDVNNDQKYMPLSPGPFIQNKSISKDQNQDEASIPHFTRRLLHNSANYQRWHLGIRSKTDVENIMREIFIVLTELNMDWNIQTKYSIVTRAHRNNKYIYIAIKIYKTGDFIYLVDFAYVPNNKPYNDNINSSQQAIDDIQNEQNNHGHGFNCEVMNFLDICSEIIISLTC